MGKKQPAEEVANPALDAAVGEFISDALQGGEVDVETLLELGLEHSQALYILDRCLQFQAVGLSRVHEFLRLDAQELGEKSDARVARVLRTAEDLLLVAEILESANLARLQDLMTGFYIGQRNYSDEFDLGRELSLAATTDDREQNRIGAYEKTRHLEGKPRTVRILAMQELLPINEKTGKPACGYGDSTLDAFIKERLKLEAAS